MLCVVFQHTMSNCVSQFSNSYLFQACWTIQMPLFVIISGYVSRYSQPITNGICLLNFIKKRTLAYLLPWFVWTILVRGVIFDQKEFLSLRFMLWHMDSGYWFLITIWTISIVFGITDFLSNKWFKSKQMNVISHIALSIVFWTAIGSIGYFVGINFFAIKLTLYYLPIYLIGFLWGQVQDWFMSKPYIKTIINSVVVFALGLWLAFIYRFDFYSGNDGIAMILGRFATSILGCIAVIGLFIGINNGSRCNLFEWAGVHSLEIYLTHYIFLGLVQAIGQPALTSLGGAMSLLVNFVLTMVLTIISIKVVQTNNQLNYLLYAKQK